MKPMLQVAPDAAALTLEAGRRLVQLASEATLRRGRFRIGLSGGRTPEGLYRALAAPPWLDAVDWSRVALIFGDERRVAADRPESNERMVREALVDRLPRPPGAFLTMDGTDPDGDRAAQAYERALRAELGAEGSDPAAPFFDLLLLGMGHDGHTASLFPGSAALTDAAPERPWVVAVPPGSVPPPVPRLTLTPPLLVRSRAILVLVTGKDKAPALGRALAEGGDERDCPIRLVRRCAGSVTFLADPAAAG